MNTLFDPECGEMYAPDCAPGPRPLWTVVLDWIEGPGMASMIVGSLLAIVGLLALAPRLIGAAS